MTQNTYPRAEGRTTHAAENANDKSLIRRFGAKAVAAALAGAAVFSLGYAAGANQESSQPPAAASAAPRAPEQPIIAETPAAAEARRMKTAATEAAATMIADLQRPGNGAEMRPAASAFDHQTYYGNKRAIVGADLVSGTRDDVVYGPESFVSVDPDTGRMQLSSAEQVNATTFNSVQIAFQLDATNPILEASRTRDLQPTDFAQALTAPGQAALVSFEWGLGEQGREGAYGPIEAVGPQRGDLTPDQVAIGLIDAVEELHRAPFGRS